MGGVQQCYFQKDLLSIYFAPGNEPGSGDTYGDWEQGDPRWRLVWSCNSNILVRTGYVMLQ